MDKRTKEKLLLTISICQDLIEGRIFHVENSEIDCIPHYLAAKSPTAAKKQGLILKQRAKPIGTLSFNGASRGRICGKLYLGKSFKLKQRTN